MKIIYFHAAKEVARDFDKQTILIGRGDGAGAPDLDLSPDSLISRRHALISERLGAYWIEDLGSKHGTTVNGESIRDQGEYRLRPGDLIEIGATTLRVEGPYALWNSPSASPPTAVDSTSEFHVDIALDIRNADVAPAPRPRREEERRLALLLDLAPHFAAGLPLDELLPLVLRRVLDEIPDAERGAVLLPGAKEDELVVRACVSPGPPAVSGLLARRALEERRGFVWRRNPTKALSNSMVQHRIATGMYVPLIAQGQPLGVFCVDTTQISASFQRDDLRLLMAVTDYLALAVSHRSAMNSAVELAPGWDQSA